MPANQTRHRQASRRVDTQEASGVSAGASPLMDKANRWGNVAREAHDQCDKGERAEMALQQRRNTSGQ